MNTLHSQATSVKVPSLRRPVICSLTPELPRRVPTLPPSSPAGDLSAPRRAGWTALAAALLAGLVLTALAWWLLPFVSDDAFISLRYAERFADGHGLTWNDGERVEGYSNLLWVLLTALLLKLGVPSVLALRLLGAACAAATLGLLACHARPRGAMSSWPCFGIGLLLVTSAPMAPWTIGGLEGPMVVLLLCLGLLALQRSHGLLLAGLPFALLCLSRPEFPLWVATLAGLLGLDALRRDGPRAALLAAMRLLLLPLVAVLLQTTFRRLYYGEWVANTARVKAVISMAGVANGLDYVGGALLAIAPLLLAALLGAWALQRQQQGQRATLLLSLAVVHLGFLVAVGGDHFLGWRLVLPVLPVFTLLGYEGLRYWCDGASRHLGRAMCVLLPLLGVVAGLLDHATQRARTERFEWQGEVIGSALHRCFGDQRPLLAVDGAGAMPYFSRLPSLDMLGLNDPVIARTAVAPPRNGYRPGHMHANGAYVLGRQPDIVQYGGPPGMQFPIFESDLQLEAQPGFLRDYRCVAFELLEPMMREPTPMRCLLWLRLEGRIGVQRTSDAIVVPAQLLNSLRQSQVLGIGDPSQVAVGDPRIPVLLDVLRWRQSPHIVVPTPQGMQLELRDHSPAVLTELEVPAGRWHVQVEADHGCEVELSAAAGPLARQGDAFVSPGGLVDLQVTAPAGVPLPMRVARVVLERQPG